MRCPKCSFITFDIVESCTKCGKDITEASEELKGTIAEVASPGFLQFEKAEAAPEAFEDTGEVAVAEDVEVDLGGEDEGVEFSLEEEETVDFAIEEEEVEEAEPEIELAPDEPEMEITPEEPEEEEIGIADLAPPEEEPTAPVEEEMVFEEEAAEEAAVATEDHEAGELEDLEVEGIDLETKPTPSDKVMPSVKTGTALDDFDIDLGDLIPGKKEE